MMLAAAVVLAQPLAAMAAPTAEQKCEGGKIEASGKYDACAAKAEKGLITTGSTTKYESAMAKCQDTLVSTWAKLEDAALGAGAVCPSTGDQVAVQDFVDACVQTIAGSVAPGGSPLPDLGACSEDLATCTGDLATCSGDLATCDGDLAACEAAPSGGVHETGQTLCYSPTGTIACAGTGQDGELLRGAANSFTDNGDGTITDNQSGLMWERLTNDGSINDKDNQYTWADAFAVKVAGLNSASYAGYSDWRLPNAKELQSLQSFGPGAGSRPTFAEFNNGCVGACTTCSCTAISHYWSSTTTQSSAAGAWIVNFNQGASTSDINKNSVMSVRAVRAGS